MSRPLIEHPVISNVWLRNPARTKAFGHALGRALPPDALVLLEGDMGSGKTTLCKALCEAWGVAPNLVHSPSYTLVNVYQGQRPIFHVDLFRLETAEALMHLAPEDWLNQAGPTLIEWPALAMPWLQDLACLQLRLAKPVAATPTPCDTSTLRTLCATVVGNDAQPYAPAMQTITNF